MLVVNHSVPSGARTTARSLPNSPVKCAVGAPMVKYRRDQYLHPESAAVAFAMSLAHKDLMLIHELAERSGTPMPQGDVHLESYGRAIEAGFGDQDMAALARYLRTQAT